MLETYRLFAYDRGWKERLRTAVFSGLTAEAAVEQVQEENSKRMALARDPYMRERLHDLDDLSWRLMRHLTGEHGDGARLDLPADAVILARAMGPADLLEYAGEKIRGLILSEGSATSHVAIVARALGLPMVTGAAAALQAAREGDDVIIDGATGEIEIRPTDQVVNSYRDKLALRSEQQAAFRSERNLPTVTKDGVEIELFMNAGLALDLPHLRETGAAGIGLFRTELQFLIGAQLPRVQAQQKLYREVLDAAGDRPVVFRTADLGGDKKAAYMATLEEANPAMGWRGVRMAIDRPGIIRPQLRALIAAAAERHLYVLIPMVTLPREIDVIREMLNKEIGMRERRGHALPRSINLGAMVETPSAAYCVEALARRVDFLSVGGNDLAQFFFAADRESELTQRRYDPLERGFLGFVQAMCTSAAAVGTPISYCGEQASDPLMSAALMGLGFRRLSMPASSIGLSRRLVRSLDLAWLSDWFKARLAEGEGSLRRELALELRSAGVVIS